MRKTDSAETEAKARAMPQPANMSAMRRIDLLTAGAVVFFLLAVVFAGAPMLKAGPATTAGLLLLIGLAGVAFLGLFVLRAGTAPPAAEPEPAAEGFKIGRAHV